MSIRTVSIIISMLLSVTAALIWVSAYFVIESAHRIDTQFRDVTLQVETEMLVLREAVEDYVEAAQNTKSGILPAREQQQLNAKFATVLERTQPSLDAKVESVHRYETIFAHELLQYRLWAWVLLGLLACSFLTTFYLFRTKFTRPFFDLERAIRKFGSGEFGKAREDGPKEFQMVARQFNEMADKLRRQRQNHMAFLASVAHDLKNPIGGIKMSADLLARKSKTEQPLLQVIQRQIMHLNSLVDDLLESSRIEAGNLELQQNKQDLRVIIQDAIQLYRSTTTIHKLQLIMPDDPVMVDCDKTRLVQVFNNLLSNAIKYSPRGGNIDVSLHQIDSSAEVSVSDSGIGIAPEDIEKIFEPFLRSDNVRGKRIPGVGLGLSTVKKIVQAHGGTIRVDSQVGRGSKFIVHLPLRKKDSAPPAAA